MKECNKQKTSELFTNASTIHHAINKKEKPSTANVVYLLKNNFSLITTKILKKILKSKFCIIHYVTILKLGAIWLI